MRIGSLVRFKSEYVKGAERYHACGSDWIGLVIDSHQQSKFLVQWNNGMRLWRHISLLEAICE